MNNNFMYRIQNTQNFTEEHLKEKKSYNESKHIKKKKQRP